MGRMVKKRNKEKTNEMKTAYLVHGWDGNPNNCWFPWIKKELEKLGYKVKSLKMPNPKVPLIKSWVSTLEKEKIDEKTILIGHSIGCQTILRYLEKTNKKVKACFLVAAWFTLELYDDLESKKIAKPWLETKIDFKKINCKNFTVFLSTDDEWVKCEENEQLFKKYLNAKVIIEENKSHFEYQDKLPFLLEKIKKL